MAELRAPVDKLEMIAKVLLFSISVLRSLTINSRGMT